MTRSEAVNDQQVWCYLTLKIGERASILVPCLDILGPRQTQYCSPFRNLHFFSTSSNFEKFLGFETQNVFRDLRTWKMFVPFRLFFGISQLRIFSYFSRSQELEYFRARMVRPWNVDRFITKQISQNNLFQTHKRLKRAPFIMTKDSHF